MCAGPALRMGPVHREPDDVSPKDDEPARLGPATGSRDEGHHEYRATAPAAQPRRGGPVPLRALLAVALAALGLADLAHELGLEPPPDPPEPRPSWRPEGCGHAA